MAAVLLWGSNGSSYAMYGPKPKTSIPVVVFYGNMVGHDSGCKAFEAALGALVYGGVSACVRTVRAPCHVFEQLLQEKEDTYHHESSSCCGNSTLQWLENEPVVGHTHELPSTRTVRALCLILLL